MPDGTLLPALTEDDRWHRKLAAFNSRRFTPALPAPGWEAEVADQAGMLLQEGEWLEGLRARVSARAAEAPRDPAGFIAWFEELDRTGPGQGDPLFPWLAETATMDEFRWFLTQEVAGEAGFEDLTALTQVRLPQQPKLELARNYWDEMGRGNPKGMHGPMLEVLAHNLGLAPTVETTVWESLALANTMSGLAASRRYAYHSVGALGVIEQTAPGRAAISRPRPNSATPHAAAWPRRWGRPPGRSSTSSRGARPATRSAWPSPARSSSSRGRTSPPSWPPPTSSPSPAGGRRAPSPCRRPWRRGCPSSPPRSGACRGSWPGPGCSCRRQTPGRWRTPSQRS